MFKNIVVGYDDSDSAHRALEKAIEISKSCGAKLNVVGVIRPLDFGLVDYVTAEEVERYEEEEISREEKFLRRAIEKIKEEGLDATYKILEGDPAEEIMTYADENGCDLIVVGRRGSGGLKRLLMGSTSSTIVKYANQSVLVV